MNCSFFPIVLLKQNCVCSFPESVYTVETWEISFPAEGVSRVKENADICSLCFPHPLLPFAPYSENRINCGFGGVSEGMHYISIRT